MKHLFVPYELALKLKEKGFDEPCFKYWYAETQTDTPYLTYTVYDEELYEQSFNGKFEGDEIQVSAPLYQQVIDWFREKHDLHIFLIGSMSRNKNEFCCEIVTVKKQTYLFTDKAYSSSPYYEALTKAIEEALKLF